ncbi:hypothetical protein HYQ46_000053 [Verticillium longisporum]|nr:hypothetical protein HYQ46_000053 [Verticillium longisporum]
MCRQVPARERLGALLGPVCQLTAGKRKVARCGMELANESARSLCTESSTGRYEANDRSQGVGEMLRLRALFIKWF